MPTWFDRLDAHWADKTKSEQGSASAQAPTYGAWELRWSEEGQRRQAEVNALLIRGIVFSLFWLCGFGSAYSVWMGWQARKLIKESDIPLDGMLRVWWCFLFGGFGVFCLLAALTTIVIKG